MKSKEYVLMKVPEAKCTMQGTSYIISKGGRILGSSHMRESWAWADAKRFIRNNN